MSKNPYESPRAAAGGRDEPAPWSRSRLGLAVVCSGAGLLLVVSILLWVADPAPKTAADFGNLGAAILWLIGFVMMVWGLIRRQARLVLAGCAVFGTGAVVQLIVIVANGFV